MNFTLPRLTQYDGVTGPLLLIILDGMGLYRGNDEGYPGNAIDSAQPKNLFNLLTHETVSYTHLTLPTN